MRKVERLWIVIVEACDAIGRSQDFRVPVLTNFQPSTGLQLMFLRSQGHPPYNHCIELLVHFREVLVELLHLLFTSVCSHTQQLKTSITSPGVVGPRIGVFVFEFQGCGRNSF